MPNIASRARRAAEPTLGPTPPHRSRSRATMAVAVLLVGVAVGAVAVSILDRRGESGAGAATADLFATEHIVFRSLQSGPDHGRIAYVEPHDPTSTRRLADPRCIRVAAAAHRAVCLRPGATPLQPYEVVELDQKLNPTGDHALNGVPSRARVAPDGRHFATTTFVSGHNYISLGFSTETLIYRVGGEVVANLEKFSFLINGEQDESVDRNIWGVTFSADSNTFFATVASRGRTYLTRGDLTKHTLTALRDNAECPSLSPDGRRIVYKKRVDPVADRAWRFHSFDLATGTETPLGETRSVDDQVAWLDSEHIMYAVPKAGEGGAADIWSAPLDGGEPKLLIPDADSPTLVGTT
ncbi:hypothetical protein FXF52_26170 [Micromonospora sp. MP36]|nr:hypothetical protein FXF52_26170 [Micromonospora sp. MP36]